MVDLPRQELAELFMILVLLMLFGNYSKSLSSRALLVVFVFSLVVSHYSLSFIFLFLLVCFWVLYSITKKRQDAIALSPRFLLLFALIIFAWYVNTGKGTVLDKLVGIGSGIASRVFSDFWTKESSQALFITSTESYPLHEVTKYLSIIVVVIVFIGVLKIMRSNLISFEGRTYRWFCVVTFLLLAIAVILPYFASTINFMRMYQITLLSLSPLFVVGFFRIASAMKPRMKAVSRFLAIALFLMVFSMFNSGLVYQLVGETSYISLDSSLDYPKYGEEELVSATWLELQRDNHLEVTSDDFRWQLFDSLGLNCSSLSEPRSSLPAGEAYYIYLGRENVRHGILQLTDWTIPTSPQVRPVSISNSALHIVLLNASVVYSNGDSLIYYAST
jgi:uncharacterized membrane protein